MKRSLLLGVFLAVTLILASAAFAQVTCYKCNTKNCKDLPIIPCGSVQGIPCSPYYGVKSDCFVFPVCDCPDTSKYFKTGEPVGIRMHILTKGVYWGVNETTLGLTAYKKRDDVCNRAGDYKSAVFEDILYFKDTTCYPDDALCPEDHDLCTWKDDDRNDGDEAHPKLKSLSTNSGNTAAFFTIPDDWGGYSYWTVQIPALRIDVNEVQSGENVKIKIEFIRPGQGGICQGPCLVICECTIEVATLCEGDASSEEGCVYFPYVVTQSAPWTTGIALTNLSDIPAKDMEATFTLTDKTGAVFKYKKNDFTTVAWSNILDNMLGQFNGTPAPGQGWLLVETNFLVDGYSFMTDGNFGGATLARPCDDDCDCHYYYNNTAQ